MQRVESNLNVLYYHRIQHLLPITKGRNLYNRRKFEGITVPV